MSVPLIVGGMCSNTLCAAELAERTRKSMIETGRAVLYLVRKETSTGKAWFITDWHGNLEFRCYPGVSIKHGRGGFGADRTDAWFTGPDGFEWHAVNRGDNQIARCKRTRIVREVKEAL